MKYDQSVIPERQRGVSSPGRRLRRAHRARREAEEGGRRAAGLAAGVLSRGVPIRGARLWGARRSTWGCPAGHAAAHQGRRPGGRHRCDSLVTVRAWK